jgi:hypothetical protein
MRDDDSDRWVYVQQAGTLIVRHVQVRQLAGLGSGWRVITAAQAVFELQEQRRPPHDDALLREGQIW